MSKHSNRLIYIIPLILAAFWIAIPTEPIHLGSKEITTHLGLDLVGGVQALLDADLPEDVDIPPEAMETARTIMENRANGLLGVGEAVVQVAGDRRIVIELPGATDPAKALSVLGETGQLEFVDLSELPVQDSASLYGTTLVTDYPETPTDIDPETHVWHTIMTGTSLVDVGTSRDQAGRWTVVFQLDSEGTEIFRDFSTANQGKILAIVLDKHVISAPVINSPIVGGRGSIIGDFTSQSANDLALQLRYGSLPIPLKVVESRTIGPSLGQDSLQRSLVAGLIGLGLVVVFMFLYYRLPGLLADLALLVYVAITFALFKLIPITLTLPGIAGFVLSIGVAVDANILIFERMKEEIKENRRLHTAIDKGWDRAWPSIRDSNLSTLITCAILFWFGSAFGASVVKGFAVTLALGVMVSLFTAIVVTRSFLHLVLDNIRIAAHPRWFGVKGVNRS